MASYAAGSGVLTIATSSELAHLRPYEHHRCVGLVRPKRIESRQVIRDVVAEQDRRDLYLDIAEVGRWEGQPSKLTSLMTTSYAVFVLKKTKTNRKKRNK